MKMHDELWGNLKDSDSDKLPGFKAVDDRFSTMWLPADGVGSD